MKKILYILLLTITSSLIAWFYVESNDGFGKGDILPFTFYSFILSLLSISIIGLYKKAFEKVHYFFGITLSIIFSIIQTFLFILILWFVFGPWIGAISFPFQICWLIGVNVANLFLLTKSQSKFNTRHLFLIFIVIGLSILVYKITYEVKDNLAENQNYDIICLSHSPNEEGKSSIQDLIKYGLSENEAKVILRQNLTGSFWTDTFFRISQSKLISTDHPNYDFDKLEKNSGNEIEFTFGNKLNSTINLNPNRIIIVMNHPLTEPFEFKEPLNTSMIIIQDSIGNGFKEIRFSEKKNLKKITIQETDFRGFPYSTSIELNLKEHGKFNIHGFQWLKK